MGDPTVNLMFSRDLDSITTPRELAVVKDWLRETDKSFYFMRDNPAHNYPILGGLWGVSISRLKKAIGIQNVDQLASKLIELSEDEFGMKKGFDQEVLVKTLFSMDNLSQEMVAYDSYTCKKVWYDILSTLGRPFPVKRLDTETDFVGNVGWGKAQYNLSKCPEECRPSYGKDWEYC